MNSWRDISLLARHAKSALIAHREEGEHEFDDLLKRFPRDGMIHFQWAEAYEAIQEHDLAVKHYEMAETYFPKAEFKQQAMAGAERCRKMLGGAHSASSASVPCKEASLHNPVEHSPDLFVIPCTKTKIWADPKALAYVQAQDAYTGEGMRKWRSDPRRESAKWLILSAKYGLIEPEHPIGKYDVTFSPEYNRKNGSTGSISQESLTAQAQCQRRWADTVPLSSFRRIYVVCGGKSKDYCERIRIAFTQAAVACDHGQVWDNAEPRK